MNATIQGIMSHTSVRQFNGQAIEPDHERLIIEAAIRGATAGNMMQYSIVKIREKERLEALAKSCDDQPFIGEAALGLLFVADNTKWHQLFHTRGIKTQHPDYQGPEIPDLMLGIQDAMIAAQNAVIAAESLGIGTCYIGDILENKEHHTAFFNLPDYAMPVTLVVFGHYDQKPNLKRRFNAQYVVFEETYKNLSEAEINDMYAAYEDGNPDFALKFYERKIHAPFFKEMVRSIKLYLNQWLRP